MVSRNRKMRNTKILIYSFYRFIEIKNKKNVKNILDKYFIKKLIRGTILIANEGINANISGTEKDLLLAIKLIRKLLKIRKINIKINKNDFLPFNRIKVRLKKEIVSLGQGYFDVNKKTGNFISPSKWDKLIIKKNLKLIDTRNIYEIEIGKFKTALNPMTQNFREFPKKFERLEIDKSDQIAMYCTGGIRCEKASAYLKSKGYKNIFQLQGGIINYLKYHKQKETNGLWDGECFVFDNRVTINKKLIKGKYVQCYGCRRPLSKRDLKSKYYSKGVTCGYCYFERTDKQKKSSMSRQVQIEKSSKYNGTNY